MSAWLDQTYPESEEREQVASSYRTQLDPKGTQSSIVLADLAKYCGFGITSFMPGEPHTTSFKEGGRDVFLHIIEMLDVKPSEFAEILSD